MDVLFALVLEAGIFAHEVQFDGVGGTAAVFGNDELGDALDIVALGVLAGTGILFGTVDKADDIGILLDGARLTQVAQLRPLAEFLIGCACLDATVEL